MNLDEKHRVLARRVPRVHHVNDETMVFNDASLDLPLKIALILCFGI